MDFIPGDVIERTFKNGKARWWIVLDPVRTSRGKLRVRSVDSGAVKTTWWHPHALPQGYRQRFNFPLNHAD